MIFVDSNAFVVLIIGLMDVNILSSHKRTSIYEAEDFDNLMSYIESLDSIITTPHVLAEVDNLLNDFSGHQKHPYIKAITNLIKTSTERHVSSLDVVSNHHFYELGLSDAIILYLKDEYHLLITADSKLSDHAKSLGIMVLDLVEYRNSRLKTGN